MDEMYLEDKRLINGEWLSEEECYEKHGGLIGVGVNKAFKGGVVGQHDREDFISEGTIGFLKAYRRFDDSKGYKFSTYAVQMVWGEVLNYYERSHFTIRKNRRLHTARMSMGDDYYILSAIELSKKYGLDLEDIDIIRSHEVLGSLDMNLSNRDDDGSYSVKDIIGAEEDFSNVYVEEFLTDLSENHRQVVELLLENKTQREIGKLLGKSQPQVSREIKKIGVIYEEWKKDGIT